MAGRSKISDEDKETLGPEATRAAQKAPAGDAERSGAAPGVKAEGDGPDTVDQLDQPAASRRAQKRADKRADEVRDIQMGVHRQNVTSVPPENVRTVFGTADGDKAPGTVTIEHVGNDVVLNTTGEVRFSGDDRMALVRAVSQLASGF